MRSRLALLLILLAAAGPISSCGKGQSSASTRTVTVQASPESSTQPSNPSTPGKTAKAQALAFARAVNLRQGDVPGYQVERRESEHSTPAQKRRYQELQRCVGSGTESQPLVEQGSLSFERKASIAQVSVSSSVNVQRSIAIATRELEAIRKSHTRSCVTHFFGTLFAGPAYKGATIGHISLESGTPPAPGTSGSFGWRLRTSVTVRSVPIPIDLDILGFFYGRSEITLTSFGLAVPFPAATEQQLFLLLLSRAKTQHRP